VHVEVLLPADSRAAPASPPCKCLFSPSFLQGFLILAPCTETQTLTCPRGANSCSSWPPAHLQASVQAGDPPPFTVVATCSTPLFHQRLAVLLVLVPADAQASQLHPAWRLSACAAVSAGGAQHLICFLSQRRQWPGGATYSLLSTYGCPSLSFTNGLGDTTTISNLKCVLVVAC